MKDPALLPTRDGAVLGTSKMPDLITVLLHRFDDRVFGPRRTGPVS